MNLHLNMQLTSNVPVNFWRIPLDRKQIRLEINLGHVSYISLAIAIAGLLWVMFFR